MPGLAYVVIYLQSRPSVVAHIEARGADRYDGPDDWRAALSWARARTPRIVFRASSTTYWAGDPALRPDNLEQIPEDPVVSLDDALREAGRTHDSLQAAIHVIRRMELERASRRSAR